MLPGLRSRLCGPDGLQSSVHRHVHSHVALGRGRTGAQSPRLLSSACACFTHSQVSLPPNIDAKHSSSPKNEPEPWLQPIVMALATLHANSLIPAAALVDLSYRFAGEFVDVDEVLGRAG